MSTVDFKRIEADIRSKTAEALDLLKDPTPENVERAGTLKGEIDERRKTMEDARAFDDRTSGMLADLKAHQEWLDTPAPSAGVPFQTQPIASAKDAGSAADVMAPGAAPIMLPNGARLLGYADAGKTRIGFGEQWAELMETGDGLLDGKQIKRLLSPEYKDAFMAYIKGQGLVGTLSGSRQKALQEGIDDQGGYWAPPDWTPFLIDRKPTPTSVVDLVTTWMTTSDRKIFPRNAYAGNSTDDPNAVLYSTNVRVTYPGEIPPSQTTIDASTPATGSFEIGVHTAMLAMDMTLNQLEDSPLAIQNWITSKFGETVRLEWANRIINGTGKGQARGILANPSSSETATDPAYVVSGSASALTGDALKGLVHDLAPQYLENCYWVMNWRNTAKAIDLLKDGQGRYLWNDGMTRDGLTVDLRNRNLCGFGVVYNEFMPNVAANAFPIVFGDLSGYYLVPRVGFSIQVLRETKAKQNMIELVGRLRFGGDIAEPWKIRVQRVSV